MKKIKVGIIGCGTIGSEIAKACLRELAGTITLVGICDIDKTKAEALVGILAKPVPILSSDDLIRAADLVTEAASAKISGDILEKCVNKNKDILVMSVGGLLGKEKLLKYAEEKGVKVYLPSGAICGIDGLKAASAGEVDSVTLTTRKPLKGLEGAPYLREKNIDIGSISGETVVFEGSAEEAVKGFPQNINVSAVLALAGIGSAETRVRIVTSPDYTKNIHEVEITGDFGRITTRTENVPSKANPKTSMLAILSAIATLRAAATSVRIGT